MSTPTPLGLVTVAPNQVPVRIRRACAPKPRYLTEARAYEAITRHMLVDAKQPLRPYLCDTCSGFHLAAWSNGHNNPTETAAIGSTDFQGRNARHYKRYQSKRHYRGVARARREAESDNRLNRLPQPNPATPGEVDAFFGSLRGERTATIRTPER